MELMARELPFESVSDIAWFNAVLRDVFRAESPTCRLERRGVDLRDAAARRALFDEIDRTSRSVLVLTEGLLLYIPEEDVNAWARELHGRPSFRSWLTDLLSPEAVG